MSNSPTDKPKQCDCTCHTDYLAESCVKCTHKSNKYTVKGRLGAFHEDTRLVQLPTPKPAEGELREQLAAIEHQRWSDWQSWCHKVLRELCPSPELEDVLVRWDKQIATPYSELSEAEKNSDREQVDRYLPLIQRWYGSKDK